MSDYRNNGSHRQSPLYYQPRDLVQALSRRLVELLGGDYAIHPDGDTTYGLRAARRGSGACWAPEPRQTFSEVY
jgi:hypothetical protein